MAEANNTGLPNEHGIEDYIFGDYFPLDYRVTATICHALIFVLGVSGNTVLIIVARRTKSLQTPTFSYLVSLAFADLIVLISAVPEAIVVHHVGTRWFLGQIGCSLFVFLNFLGINAGSLSILAFTVEQYIAVCCGYSHRLKAAEGTRKHVIILWIFSLIYCCPWLGLTEVRPDEHDPDNLTCELRLSREVYRGVFAADLLLFYITPLIFAVYAYSRIGWALIRTTRYTEDDSPSISSHGQDNTACFEMKLSKCNSTPNICNIGRLPSRNLHERRECVAQSRTQVVQMLVVIVLCFAVAWLPFRVLLVYNSFVDEPWLNLWFMFMAKTLIFANSAMNPFLYNAMSPRFRLAVIRLLCRRKKRLTSKKQGSSDCRPLRPNHDALFM